MASEVMVERYIHGRELTCGVMGDQGAMDVTEVVPLGHNFYDYDAKYASGGSKHVLPAKISPKIYQKIQTLALRRIKQSGAAASAGPTFVTTTVSPKTARLSGWRSIPSRA